jgi:UDP-glucose 4-epimerase
MKKVLVVGKNSFLAKAFVEKNNDRFEILSIRHEDFDSVDLNSFSDVINMAYDPQYFSSGYNSAIDFDLRVARSLVEKRPHYFMMSTRKVYGSNPPFPVDETAPVAAEDFYGGNKAITETEVFRTLGPKCTILRIANVFGFEPGRHTFLGIALMTLKRENRILLDVSPFTLRDFLPVDNFAAMLGDTVMVRPTGTFNMGSGEVVPVGQIALWVIEGFGNGELVINQTSQRDRFFLNTQKLNKAIGHTHGVDVRSKCLEIGRRLRDA